MDNYRGWTITLTNAAPAGDVIALWRVEMEAPDGRTHNLSRLFRRRDRAEEVARSYIDRMEGKEAT